jgi:predicted kinase
MKNNQARTVYVLSGPAGVGKSTISKELTKKLRHSAYISGDYISHMHINGRKKPWESKEELSLLWDNILSLTRNFLAYGNDVVVDYVTFPQEAAWFHENLKDGNVNVVYVVLWADNETLIRRDEMRNPEYKMGERCLLLAHEFKESGVDEKHLFNTSRYTTKDMDSIIEEIMKNPRFRMS